MTQIAHPELDGIGKYEYGWADQIVVVVLMKRLCAIFLQRRMNHNGC